jgi:tRNA pseudouridine55 synthase
MIEGLLLVDKPENITSFGVVSRVRGCLKAGLGVKKLKVGHSGTLDPAATGLLILAVGSYTKKIPQLLLKDKEYLVTMKLGFTSTTGDKEGEIASVSDRVPSKSEITKTLEKFTGTINQTPPIYSAIKVDGRRAYDLAREGKPVVMKAREATIFSNKLLTYEYPHVTFVSHVASGTYIRSLVEDMGKSLETGAYMSDLRRTKIGTYSVENAMAIDSLSYSKIHDSLITLDD